jgi:deoxyadenosine/deoxycytidine kinase
MHVDDCMVMHDHPQWSSRSVTLICGPPGSGKSTLAAELHQRTIEVEDFADAPTPRHQLRYYGRAVARVGKQSSADVAVVRCAAGRAEREHHERLCRPACTIVLLVDAETCHDRVAARGRPTAAGEHEGVDAWWTTWRAEND